MSADDMLMGEWRGRGERAELVERLIATEKRLRLAESELRDRVQREEAFLAGHPTEAALMQRIRELESIVQRLNDNIARKAS